MPALLFITAVLAIVALVIWTQLRRARRADFIRRQPLPQGLFVKLQARHPQLSLKDCQLVAQALRQFFLAWLHGGFKPVSMPSQVVDDLWHEFILHTRTYDAFCRGAFGRFLHHTPAVAMGGERRSNEGLRRVWWQCCRAENIDPSAPTRLPLLFAIDAKLAIAGGFRYVPNCGPLKAQTSGEGSIVIHCGGDFADAGIDGSTDGFGDGGGGDGGGDGGGCGN